MQDRILSFPCNVVFMTSLRDLFNSWSCRFMRFGNFSESCLCFRCFGFSTFYCNGFPIAGLGNRSFSWRCSCHRCFQLPSCILDDVFVLFITRKNKFLSNFWHSLVSFSSAHSCFSFLLAAFPILVQASSHI